MSDDPTIEPTGDPVIDALLGQREAGAPERRRRTGGHAAAGERSRLPPQRPWAQPRLRYAPTEVVSADELESIHLASLRVLEEIGMDFLDPDARALLKTAGADVREGSERVRFDRGMVLERIVTAPSVVHPARHEPRPRPRHRRGLDRVRVGGERAERQRPRPRPARRATAPTTRT